MKLSFVIPAHNEKKLIGRCLKSILKEVAPGTHKAEIIVVDNVSTDGTREEALRHPKVTVVDEPFRGLSQARRAGFVVSTGELIANLYADTELSRGWLQKVMEAFAEDEQLVGLSGPYMYKGADVVDRVVTKILYGAKFLFYFFTKAVFGVGELFEGGNLVMRRSALLLASGGDATAMFSGGDTEMIRRISKIGEVRWMWSLPIIRVK
ncbi:hypothetical protein A2943_03490 [Candidatus Adlerbacteria bacterium RIFCSPLOWO2_01_FULL_51_16]|uniref:Glycosyltransferase 2-like domain-containing protein n=1 Tax=Candidatus Adlerbacteria bacterium RIFCSPLOWO2_01_FULL_51_16 TaxID=1797243 RepID=A0A1F4XEZ8_9BACT|nr:MAG: hypothetical protein A2943_03490 [Candidatus Adlerbacteria bacterium RIFCSPLOWO2_01_FULL_51_16]